MSKLILMCGPAGSGKDTYIDNHLQNYYRISQDDQQKEHLPLFLQALKDKKDIVVSRMNFDKKQRIRYLGPAKELEYETELIVLHENRETCYKRIINRYNHATIEHGDTESANSALDTFFTRYERPTPDEADTITFKYPVTNLKLKALVIDLDNTLSDATHREHFLQSQEVTKVDLDNKSITTKRKPNWPAFFAAMGDDPLNEWCKDLMKRYREDHILILNSGRPDSYRKITEEWLEKHNVPYDHLFMRHHKDSRKDDIVKELLMDFECLTRVQEIKLWIDDRKSVIDKIRSRGVRVLDVAGNTF